MLSNRHTSVRVSKNPSENQAINTSRIMDPMDIDQIVEVPDTPDRLASRRINGSDIIADNHRSLTPSRSEKSKFIEEGTKDKPLLIHSRSRGPSIRPPKSTSNSGNSVHPIPLDFSLANLPASGNGCILRRRAAEKKPRYQNNDYIRPSHAHPGRPSISSKSSLSQDDDFVDPAESNPHISFPRKAYGTGVVDKMPRFNADSNRQHVYPARPSCSSKPTPFQDDNFVDPAESNPHRFFLRKGTVEQKNYPAEFQKRSFLADGDSSSRGTPHSQDSLCHGMEEMGNMNRVSLSNDFEDRVNIAADVQNVSGKACIISRNPISSPRANKQKKLVRNGCIDPSNIAKAKQMAGKDINCSVGAPHNVNGSTTSSVPPISVDIRELVAEESDSNRRKGKGVISLTSPSKGTDSKNKNLPGRSSTSFSEKALVTGDCIIGKRSDELGGWRSTHNQTGDMNMSSDDEERESGSHLASRTGRFGRFRSNADTISRTHKLRSTSTSSRGESSASGYNCSEKAERLSSSAKVKNPESSSSGMNNLPGIVTVDELSLQARQLEEDERLARELQEQLYNEVPAFGIGEQVDENLALALQNQDDPIYGFPRTRSTTSNARNSFISSLRRQAQSRSSPNAPRRGSPLARASALGRTARLSSSRFPGQPRSLLPSRGRSSLFSADMDVEMRMHILGALEEFSDAGMSAAMLHGHRDFNEDDYEMLLALDDNNDSHCGASNRHINGLPLSTVQTDNYEEACAVCLDVPTIGDTIRHLPCLHKFHKDCIDPWLRRRKSCPICKSSIT